MEAGERRAGLAVAAVSGREAQGMGEPLEPGRAGRMMPRVELLLRRGHLSSRALCSSSQPTTCTGSRPRSSWEISLSQPTF